MIAVGDVVVGAGLLRTLGARARAAVPGAHRWAVCIDETVDRLHGTTVRAAVEREPMGGPVTWLLVPSGERHKTRETWARLTDALLEAGHGRDTALMAVGGGVTGDLAGFVAATYLRGVPFVQVPTTLLAMVDASIGGKTGVDVPAGKNLVGAFHPARAVLADPTVLATLPMPERRAGFAEMLKHGAIADAAHFEQLVADASRLLAPDAPPDPLVEAIATSVRLKASVVSNDPTEVGQRAILNAGHTIAHAIEHLTGYAVRHGEAVAMGLVLEAAAGEALGVTAAGTSGAMRRACEAAGLPVALPSGLSADALLQAMRLDKKARAGAVRCALPADIGRMARDGEAWTIPVPDDVWRAVLRN